LPSPDLRKQLDCGTEYSRFPESLISPKKFSAQMVGCNDLNLEPSIHYVTTI
jgi:hypothetical protein